MLSVLYRISPQNIRKYQTEHKSLSNDLIFSAGLRCTQQCPEGTWGLQCNHTCSCLNSATCQAHTGTCLCKPGFWGAQCQHSKYSHPHPCVSESSGHIRADLESARIFSLQCAVLDYSESGAAVSAHHVYMPPPAITLQAIVCVCLDIPDNCVNKVRYTHAQTHTHSKLSINM